MSTKKDENKIILPDIKNIKTQETFTLPSKGLLYSETENIPASITLRRMTTKEDKIRMRNSTEDRIRRDILDACILDEGVNAGNLKLMDANFLLFRLRSLSLLDDKYKIQCRCNKCGSIFIHEVNLSEVPVEYLNKKKIESLELVLPVTAQKVTFKFPSLNDMIRMGDSLRSYFEKFPNADKGEAVYTTSVMLYIDKVNNEKMISEELEDWIDNLDILDSRTLRKHVDTLEDLYGFNKDLKTKCPTCQTEVEHGLPITGELFNPSL